MRKLIFGLSVGLLVAGLAALATAGHNKGNIDELRFGIKIAADGEVPPNTSRSHFPPHTPIHITMRIQEAVTNTPLLVVVLDRQTEELAWSDEKTVPGGHAVMHFLIASGELRPGKYRARVKLGDDWVAEHEFKIEPEH